ncbi:MAG TPA: MBL fold metallo-hydrolase [Steroidobacteraceae bacterium]|nr:MBL fold metallo-hydrolase [Steroidobacteraceae bacterium]
MSKWRYDKGLQSLGNGCYAYLQPDGTWGWSNAGLIVSDGQTLLVDTLMGLRITRDMLEEMKLKIPAAGRIDKLVNTHANPDHFLGNELVGGAEIISTRRTAADIAKTDIEELAQGFQDWQKLGDAGEFLHETMGRSFDVAGVTITPPTRTYEGQLSLTVGSKLVRLIDLGPAHTASDTLVHVPEDRTIFTGDLLFNEGTPIMWAGPVQNWIAACDYILGLDVEIIVPGHGPIADKGGVRAQKAYFQYVHDEARKRFDAGLAWEDAAMDISLGEFGKWTDAERLVSNVFALYREFGAAVDTSVTVRSLFGAMGRWRKQTRTGAGCDHVSH